jgi:phosphoribosylglycinamide formyltransferase-1
MINLAVFASGSGSNAENLAHFFTEHPKIRLSLILSNRPDAFVLQRAKQLNIPACIFNKDDFYHSDKLLKVLSDYKIDRLVLAGFLWLIPDNLLKAFPRRIINIHPALLPNYGGKGMYGHHVHEAVVANGEKKPVLPFIWWMPNMTTAPFCFRRIALFYPVITLKQWPLRYMN